MSELTFRYETDITSLSDIHSFIKVFREFALATVCKSLKQELKNHPAMPLNKDCHLYDIEKFITDLDFEPYVNLFFYPLKNKTLFVLETNFLSVSNDLNHFPYISKVEISKNSSENQEKKKDWDEFYHIYAHELGGKYWNRHFKMEVINSKILINNRESMFLLKSLLSV